ncbi:MAG: hypothetical protein IT349_19415 [Candidatus Eisenbacteria bacterium]|nr:hypothetical protein [Candidatus Eisenbacteria bacterium]
MRQKLIESRKVDGFQSVKERNADGRLVTVKRVPVTATAELWIDPELVIASLYGRAINSSRKRSVLGGGLITVKVKNIKERP